MTPTPDPIRCLIDCGFLGAVHEVQLRALSPSPQWIKIAAGATLIEQGQEPEALYVLVHGRMRALVADAGKGQRVIGDISPGETIGEMSLISGEETSATVRAMHDSELVRFSRESFLHLVERFPETMLQITRTLIGRLRRGIGPVRRELAFRRIAVVPLNASLDRQRFANRLARHLREHASAVMVDPGSLPSPLRESARRPPELEGAARHALVAWLAEQEDSHALAVYLADPEPTAWTRTALRQADLVLLAAEVGADPTLTPLERQTVAHLDPLLAPRIDLALIHGESWRVPNGAAAWLSGRTVSEHHHLRWRDEDFARLARVIVGRAIGLVLGGGGARGFAQIGVIRALREAGIPIDRVGGTSMGALIGAHVAMGLAPQEIHARNRALWVEARPLSDITYPAMALYRGRRLRSLLRDELGVADIEELPIRFFCVSSNLTAIDLAIHDRGPLWAAVCASGSLPGAAPPMFYNGQVLVDGAVLNNLPGDIMYERFAGRLVVVDVSPLDGLQAPLGVPETPSGWAILWRRLLGQPWPVPTMPELLYKTATLSSSLLSKRTYALADLVLTPPVSRYGVMQLRAIDTIVEAGYRYAIERLETLEGDRASRLLVPPSGEKEAAIGRLRPGLQT